MRNQHRRSPFARKTVFVVVAAVCGCITIAAPQSSKTPSNSSKAAKSKPNPAMQLIKPLETVLAAPKNDPLRSLTAEAKAHKAKLVYSSYVPFEGSAPPYWQHYLTMRRVGTETNEEPSVLTQMMDVKAPFWVFEPKFSPNGQYVLFKYGDPFNSQGAYNIFLWNLKTRRIQPGPAQRLSQRQVLWSPNSKYIAFIEGNTFSGWSSNEALKLFVFDVESGQSHTIVVNPDVEFAWTPQNTLLFGWIPDGSQSNKRAIARPAGIYEASPTGGEPKLLIKSGSNPLPSPDGAWVLFRGLADPDLLKEEKDEDDGFGLYLFNRADKKRYLVPVSPVAKIAWQWMPDSQRLIALRKNAATPNVATVTTVDTATRTLRKSGEFTGERRPVAKPRSPLFTGLSVSPDGKFLYVLVTEFGANRPNGLAETFGYIKAMELSNGSVSTLAEVNNASGLDWYTGTNLTGQ